MYSDSLKLISKFSRFPCYRSLQTWNAFGYVTDTAQSEIYWKSCSMDALMDKQIGSGTPTIYNH